MQALREHLLSLQDTKYQKFHSALCPGIDNIIGIRIPVLRKLANEILRDGDYPTYLQKALYEPFVYSEEATLCGMILGLLKIDLLSCWKISIFLFPASTIGLFVMLPAAV